MTADAETSKASTVEMSDPSAVRDWLARYHPKQLALLDKFEIELRLGRLSAASSTSGSSATTVDPKRKMDRREITVRTVELLKIMVGGTHWRTPAQLVTLLRGLGRELHSAGGFREPAIENVVRRIIAAVREEVMNGANADDPSGKRKHDRSLEGMLWALPQHVKTGRTLQQVPQHGQRSESFGDITELSDLPPPFFQNRPDLKQCMMEAIQEITSELEDLHKNICEQCTNQIHAGEVILTYGRSQTVELVSYRRVSSVALKLWNANAAMLTFLSIRSS
jgi:translation initiation factor eIF-2B subunit beta